MLQIKVTGYFFKCLCMVFNMMFVKNIVKKSFKTLIKIYKILVLFKPKIN